MPQYSLKSPFSLVAQIKDADIKNGIVCGYASAFGNLDSDNDIIMPGAFAKSIKENGPGSTQPRIKHLLNHNTSEPIGAPQVLKEDTIGLYYESKTGQHALGRDFMLMVDSGLITEHSIGFQTIRKTVTNPDADWRDRQTQIHEVRLWEFSSLTAWGANPNTPLTAVKCAQRIPVLTKAIKDGKFTDETFYLLIKELDFLKEAFDQLSITPISGETTPPLPSDDSTVPGEENKGVDIAALKALIKLSFA